MLLLLLSHTHTDPPPTSLGSRGQWPPTPAEDAVKAVDAAIVDVAAAATATVDDTAERVGAAAAAVAEGATAAADNLEAVLTDGAEALSAAASSLDASVKEGASAVDNAIAAAAARAADAAQDPAGTAQAAAADARAAVEAGLSDAGGAVEAAATAARGAAADVKAAWGADPSPPPSSDLPLTLVGGGGGGGWGEEGGVGVPPAPADILKALKARLVSSLAPLDRGAAASPAAVAAVEAAAGALIASAGGPVDLRWAEPGTAPAPSSSGAPPPPASPRAPPSTMDALAGTWRLLYSSAFAKARRGAGASSSLGPARLGQILQEISPYGGTLANIVQFTLPPPPLPPGLPALPAVAPVVITATLRHTLEAGGGGPTVRITFEGTDVRGDGGLGGFLGAAPALTLPSLPDFLRPSRAQRSSTFDVLYLDGDLRIGRGERGELRVHARVA